MGEENIDALDDLIKGTAGKPTPEKTQEEQVKEEIVKEPESIDIEDMLVGEKKKSEEVTKEPEKSPSEDKSADLDVLTGKKLEEEKEIKEEKEFEKDTEKVIADGNKKVEEKEDKKPTDLDDIFGLGGSTEELSAEKVEDKEEKSKSVIDIFGEKEEEKFVVEEEPPEPKMVFTVAGEKDSGKTFIALDFINYNNEDNTLAAIAFDNKTARVRDNDYNADSRIHVFNGNKYFTYAKKEDLTNAARLSILYLEKVLDKIEEISPDIILIDNFEKFTRIAEFAARYSQRLGPFDSPPRESGVGFKIWDERNFYVTNLFNRCFSIAKKVVVYAIYMRDIDIMRDGVLLERKKEPKWASDVKYETDVTLILEKENGREYSVEIVASKDDKNLPNGLKLDVTDKGFWKALKEHMEGGTKEKVEVELDL